MSRRGSAINRGRTRDGWLFISPAVLVLGLFLALPVLMAAWVSVSDWRGSGSPVSSDVGFVGLDNYRSILTGGTLAQRDFGTSLRNNFYYVLFVVPLQTALALFLAMLVHTRMLRGRGLLPHGVLLPVGDQLGGDHGAVAVPVQHHRRRQQGARAGSGINGPNWFQDPRGICCTSRSAASAWTPRRAALDRATTSWASAGGTGCPGRRSRCPPAC